MSDPFHIKVDRMDPVVDLIDGYPLDLESSHGFLTADGEVASLEACETATQNLISALTYVHTMKTLLEQAILARRGEI